MRVVGAGQLCEFKNDFFPICERKMKSEPKLTNNPCLLSKMTTLWDLISQRFLPSIPEFKAAMQKKLEIINQ